MKKPNKLYRLLDFSHCDSKDKIINQLVQLGRQLFYHYRLVTPHHQLRITAIELYLKNHPIIDDPTAHHKNEQLQRGTFYVHRKVNFNSPQYGGLDITCGSEKNGIYGGILIREINFEDGSAKALSKIIRGKYEFKEKPTWTEKEKILLSKIKGASIFEGSIFLEPFNFSEDEKIYTGPRILTKKQQLDHTDLAKLPLRVAMWPTQKQKRKMAIFSQD